MRGRLLLSGISGRHDGAEDVLHHLLVRSRDRRDAVGIAVLGDGKGKGAPPKFRAVSYFIRAFEIQLDLVSRSAPLSRTSYSDRMTRSWRS